MRHAFFLHPETYQYALFSSVLYPGGRSEGKGEAHALLFKTFLKNGLDLCHPRQRLPMMPNHICSEPPMYMEERPVERK